MTIICLLLLLGCRNRSLLRVMGLCILIIIGLFLLILLIPILCLSLSGPWLLRPPRHKMRSLWLLYKPNSFRSLGCSSILRRICSSGRCLLIDLWKELKLCKSYQIDLLILLARIRTDLQVQNSSLKSVSTISMLNPLIWVLHKFMCSMKCQENSL